MISLKAEDTQALPETSTVDGAEVEVKCLHLITSTLKFYFFIKYEERTAVTLCQFNQIWVVGGETKRKHKMTARALSTTVMVETMNGLRANPYDCVRFLQKCLALQGINRENWQLHWSELKFCSPGAEERNGKWSWRCG